MVYVPSVVANVRGLTGSAGSTDVLVRGATVGSQFGAAATFAVLQIAAAAAVLRGLRRRRRRGVGRPPEYCENPART